VDDQATTSQCASLLESACALVSCRVFSAILNTPGGALDCKVPKYIVNHRWGCVPALWFPQLWATSGFVCSPLDAGVQVSVRKCDDVSLAFTRELLLLCVYGFLWLTWCGRAPSP
jgi:hypothetical protein